MLRESLNKNFIGMNSEFRYPGQERTHSNYFYIFVRSNSKSDPTNYES